MKTKKAGTIRVSTFHKKLTLQLVAVGLMLALLAGFAAWMKERHRLGDAIIARALSGASAFNIYIDHLIEAPEWPDKQAVQAALEKFRTRRRLHDPNGKFVSIRIYDDNSNMISKLSLEDYPLMDAVNDFLKSSPLRFPNNEDEIAKVMWMEDIPHIQIVLPLTNHNGDPVAYIEGIFGVSQEALDGIRRRITVTVLWVVAIILATTALLFPTIIMLTRKLRLLTINLLDSNLETLKVLGSAIAKRDSDTDAHNYRVTIYAVRLAEEIGMDLQTIQSLIKGAFLHDVGKIGIEDKILLKPGRLNDKEFEIMKAHVPHGLDIVRRSAWLKDATEVVGHHHNKFDGSGYGSPLEEGEVPVSALIFAIADVFDALTSRRPYKEPFSLDETMEILREGRGTHFDPKLLDAFEKIAGALHEEFAGREDDGLKDQLEKIIQRYFSKDLDISMERESGKENNN